MGPGGRPTDGSGYRDSDGSKRGSQRKNGKGYRDDSDELNAQLLTADVDDIDTDPDTGNPERKAKAYKDAQDDSAGNDELNAQIDADDDIERKAKAYHDEQSEEEEE